MTGIVCRAVRQLGAGSTGRLGLKLTTGGIEVDVGGSRRFSEVATGGLAISVGLQVWMGHGREVQLCFRLSPCAYEQETAHPGFRVNPVQSTDCSRMLVPFARASH